MNARYRKLDEVWTSDGQKLGLAQRLFHRTEGVEPAILLYESYLEVENFELGSTYFVPTDFIEEGEGESGKLKISKSFNEVQELTWFRMPIFAARGDGREESLYEE
jgi:hypothetical protein